MSEPAPRLCELKKCSRRNSQAAELGLGPQETAKDKDTGSAIAAQKRRTTMRSAPRMVERRWAMTMHVRCLSRISSSRASCTMRSDSVSSALVASSSCMWKVVCTTCLFKILSHSRPIS